MKTAENKNERIVFTKVTNEEYIKAMIDNKIYETESLLTKLKAALALDNIELDRWYEWAKDGLLKELSPNDAA